MLRTFLYSAQNFLAHSKTTYLPLLLSCVSPFVKTSYFIFTKKNVFLFYLHKNNVNAHTQLWKSHGNLELFSSYYSVTFRATKTQSLGRQRARRDMKYWVKHSFYKWKLTAKAFFGPSSLAIKPGIEFNKVNLPASKGVGTRINSGYLSGQYYHCLLAGSSVFLFVAGSNVKMS